MKINLYTLPTCGICNMVKIKLRNKHINFYEKPFREINMVINSDRAPVLEIINETGQKQILTSPSAIVQWINTQGG